VSEYETGRCVVGSKAHSADVGYLCTHHLDRLAANLRTVEEQAALLTAVPSFQQRTGNRGGSLASHRAPARLEVLVHNDPRHGTGRSEDDDDALAAGETLSILGTLGSWARLVREERQLSAPATVTISGERDLLSRNLSWIVAQDWIDEFEHDIRSLAGQLRAQNGTTADRPFSTCPRTIDDYPCGGNVWTRDEMQPVWRRYPDRCSRTWEQAPGAAVCDTCGAVWATEADKARLRKMVDDAATEAERPRTEDGRPMRTAAELASDLGVSVNAVRLRLSKARLRAVNGSYYDPEWLRRADVAS